MKALDSVALTPTPRLDPARMEAEARAFADRMHVRRTVRQFSSEPVAAEVIRQCVRAAASAPSGANRQPWHFVAVSNGATKAAIREAAEAEEREFYQHRASNEWLDALAALGTNAEKPFLVEAPWLIAVFAERHGVAPDGRHIKNYYTPESVGIAVGMLLTALHGVGLATLTHTPSPMNFLRDLLARPVNERAYLLVVTGYPADGARVPAIHRKELNHVLTLDEGHLPPQR